MSWVAQIFLALLAIQIPVSAGSQTLPLDEWVHAQLQKEKLEQVTVIEAKLWPYAPQPNTYVILVEATKNLNTLNPAVTRFVAMLVHSSSSLEVVDPKLIGYGPVNSYLHRASIDVAPYQIRQQEYAFGIRTIDDSLVGNKIGLALEYLYLFRYQPSELKQIFDEVIWGYTKYSEPGGSCNTETMIVSEPPEQGEFFKLIRKHSRSYLGDARMYPFSVKVETPLDSCPAFRQLQFPNVHTWDSTQGQYMDPEFSPRHEELGKHGSPYR
jgi:hypothetical protein